MNFFKNSLAFLNLQNKIKLMASFINFFKKNSKIIKSGKWKKQHESKKDTLNVHNAHE